ncbi:MAG TPA: 30S ribosome-binding factor RbfA [Candidatus Kapabacteria bacterium]|nr:30S ribosome-binding factor RbfA [Candidatus Kapabacteria bacterium]
MSIRTERVAGEVQQALARALQTDFSDLSDGLITVTKVRMSPDLRSGRVYISLLGGTRAPERTLEKIKAETPRLRAAIAKAIRLRYVPELHFYLDDTQQEVARVETILKQIGEEKHGADASEKIASNE